MFLRSRKSGLAKTRSRWGNPLDPFSRFDQPCGSSIAATSTLLDPFNPIADLNLPFV
jgi:hypothetical protein